MNSKKWVTIGATVVGCWSFSLYAQQSSSVPPQVLKFVIQDERVTLVVKPKESLVRKTREVKPEWTPNVKGSASDFRARSTQKPPSQQRKTEWSSNVKGSASDFRVRNTQKPPARRVRSTAANRALQSQLRVTIQRQNNPYDLPFEE